MSAHLDDDAAERDAARAERDAARDEREAARLVTLVFSFSFNMTIERARDVVAACGGARLMASIMRGRRFGSGGNAAFPAHPRLQWMDWAAADEIQEAWIAADEPLGAVAGDAIARAASDEAARRCARCGGGCPPHYCYREHL